MQTQDIHLQRRQLLLRLKTDNADPRQMVDLVGSNPGDHRLHAGTVKQVDLDIGIQADRRRWRQIGADHPAATRLEQFGQIRSVLAQDTGDEGSLAVHGF